MNPLLRIVLLAGLVLAALVYGIGAHTDAVKTLEFDLAKERLRAAFTERTAYTRSLEDTERWANELVSASRWYESEWTNLLNRHPERRAESDVLATMEAQVAAGQMPKQELENRREWYDATQAVHALLSSGRYTPIASAISNGVRLDILGMKRQSYAGRERMRLDVALWGAPRREVLQKNDGGATLKRQLDFNFTRLSLEFIDDNEKLIGGGDTGAPTLVVDHPERWIPQFPPMAALGTYWIEAFPENTATVDLRIAGDIRSPSAGPIPVSFEWRLPVRAEWKVGAGEAFEGEERLLPAEEIDRSAGR